MRRGGQDGAVREKARLNRRRAFHGEVYLRDGHQLRRADGDLHVEGEGIALAHMKWDIQYAQCQCPCHVRGQNGNDGHDGHDKEQGSDPGTAVSQPIAPAQQSFS
ncbi:MAG: hypothetical protein Q8O40_14440 [Chloroflexota bacterium]|nr:hypothetical protein [Chloroflexota bacterium]